MDKVDRICHDLKTERPDVGRPLAGVLRLVPIALYFSTLAFIAGIAWLSYEMHQARQARASWKTKELTWKSKQGELTKKLDEIKLEEKKALDVLKWVQASEPLQELVVCITQNMEKGNSMTSLSLERAKDNARQIKMRIYLNKGGSKQIDKIRGQIANALNYKLFEEQKQEQKGGAFEWSATLMRPDGARPTVTQSNLPQ